MTTDKKKNFLINTLYFFSLVALVFLTYRFFTVYFFPFLIGLVLAYMLQKPSEVIAKKIKLKKGTVAAVLTAICFCSIVVLCILLITFIFSKSESIITALRDLLDFFAINLKRITERLRGTASGTSSEMAEIFKNIPMNLADSMGNYLTNTVSKTAAGIIKNGPALLISTVVTVVASFYTAKDYNIVKAYILSLVPDDKKEIVFATKRIVNKNILKIVRGYLILMIITFTILLVGLSVIGIKNAVLFSFLIALIDLLPVLGTGTVLIPWIIFLFFGQNYAMAFSILALYLIILAVRNFLEPKIVGRQIGIPPLVMLILFFLGLRLFGFIGMIFSVISLVVIVNLYKENLISL